MSFDPPPLPPQYGPLQVWWEAVRQGLKTEFGALEAADAAMAAAIAAQADADAAQADADAAQSTANTAQTTATTVKRDDSITASYTAPGTVLTATDAGSSATITVATHTRVYGDISNKSVTGDTITGLSYSTEYYVYYDQTSRAGGAVTYHATTNANTALPNKAAGRHLVGKVTTPAAGGGSTSGGSSPPSGGGNIDQNEITSTL